MTKSQENLLIFRHLVKKLKGNKGKGGRICASWQDVSSNGIAIELSLYDYEDPCVEILKGFCDKYGRTGRFIFTDIPKGRQGLKIKDLPQESQNRLKLAEVLLKLG